jgi:hypothetical protein
VTAVALCLVLTPLVPACSRRDAEADLDPAHEAELVTLRRQVEGLRGALVDSQRGALVSPDHIAIGVDEETARNLLAATLPIERVIADDFDARIDTATVAFRSFEATVTLEGRVTRRDMPETYADLILHGAIPGVEIDRAGRTLRADIVLDSFEVKRAAAVGAEHDLVKLVARRLGERGLAELRGLVPALRFPVSIEQEIAMPAIHEGPVSIPAATLPLEASVARVLAASGRLWAMVEVRNSAWRSAAR